MRYIFIETTSEHHKVGIVEDNRLVEFHLDKIEKEKLIGNIYRGRVINVLQGMEAAFIDIGEDKNTYLNVKDALPKDLLHSNERYKISELLKPGQEIIVQVKKEPYGNKGAKVTTHIEIPGRYLVFTPFSKKVNISRKIESQERIRELKKLGHEIVKDEQGIIFRTASELAEDSLLAREYEILHSIYSKIEREKNFLPCPKLLYREPTLGYQILRDTFNKATEKILVNSKEVYEDLIEMEEFFPFKFSQSLEYRKDFSIRYDLGILEDIRHALEKKVPLPSGGYIVIDETEALVAIDVNTGKYVGSKSLGDTVLKTNLEAAQEIAKQIRLRDIGGIIIIDFIDMKKNDHIETVLTALDQHLKKDRIKVNIVDITKLGLVELTRKKIRRPLTTEFYRKCPHCSGKGYILENEY
ncbi:MAG: Rne/Rng family ribonuclease [Tissierellaceae bacterium]